MMKTPQLSKLRPFLIPLGIVAAMAILFFALGIRINVTASIPLGLYIRSDSKPAPGLIAEFCPVGMSQAESERYRGFGLACPDRNMPLMKPIVAVSGDQVTFAATGISVNGRLIPNTAPRKLDGQGRPIRSWPGGDYTVEPGKVVVASDYHPGSYDSRYFGPIAVADLRLNLRPLWVFDAPKKARSHP